MINKIDKFLKIIISILTGIIIVAGYVIIIYLTASMFFDINTEITGKVVTYARNPIIVIGAITPTLIFIDIIIEQINCYFNKC